MAEVPAKPPKANQVWRMNYRTWLAAAAVLSLGVVLVVGVRWLANTGSDLGKKEDQSLEAQWNKAIERLGIEPVYPPAEDLTVGDLLAQVVEDDQLDPNVGPGKLGRSTPSLRKSVKLAHIDVTKELNEVYAELPFFPEIGGDAMASSAQRSTAVGPNPGAPPTPGLAFRSDGSRTALPRAAFPDFTIVHAGSAAAGLSAARYGLFHFGASSEDLQKLQVRTVETYGLPNVSADTALKAYCNADRTRSVCSEKVARMHLQTLVGDRVLTCYVDPTTGKRLPAVTIQVLMVSRVYLAHSISSESTNSRSEGGAGQVALTPSGAVYDTTSKGPPGQPTSMATEAATDSTRSYDALKKRLDELESHFKDLRQGGAVTYRSESEREIQLDQTFPRGLVIGFRSVPHEFEQKYGCEPSN